MSDEDVRRIERKLVHRSAVDNSSGELLYEITSGSLEGSWDHRVSLRVLRTRLIPDPTDKRKNKMIPVFCPPYLWLEGSVHKALMGHNVHGGPSDVVAPCSWFVEDLGDRLGVRLPPAAEWLAMRVDWAEVFRMPREAISAYVRSLNSCEFPRRSVHRYGDESLLSPGFTSTVKLYHKGSEFFRHDYRRLNGVFDREELKELVKISGETLRVEVAIKKRKISSRYGRDCAVGRLELGWVKEVFDHEVKRLVREAAVDMKIVRDTHNVKARLESVYTGRQAAALFATWVQLAALGERSVKEDMSRRRSSFYDHRAKLLKAGVAWTGSDVVLGSADGRVPADFVPVRSDPRCANSEDPRVSEALEEHRREAA